MVQLITCHQIYKPLSSSQSFAIRENQRQRQREADRQTETDRHTERQTDRQTDRQTGRQRERITKVFFFLRRETRDDADTKNERITQRTRELHADFATETHHPSTSVHQKMPEKQESWEREGEGPGWVWVGRG